MHLRDLGDLEDDAQRRGLIELVETNGLSVREAERRVHQLRRVAEVVGESPKAGKLVSDILRPQGVSDAALDAAVTPAAKGAKAAKPAPGKVDLRELAVFRLIETAQASGTFTVSNLGMFGIQHFTAVINPPQAAILAVGALETRPVWDGEQFVPRSLMTMTLSVDHRVLYGADAARFLGAIRDGLQQPLRLAM